jgi:pimeloyl-ACP methyl ester carboxylesterase
VGLIYTLNNPQNVKRLVLTGSSGLFENAMGGSFPKRGSYDYIKERVAYTFYEPATANKELVDEVFDITKDIPKCMRIVAIAKSAQRHNMAREITKIQAPTLLVWGLNDTITPPLVAYEFDKLIPNSELRFIDKVRARPDDGAPRKIQPTAHAVPAGVTLRKSPPISPFSQHKELKKKDVFSPKQRYEYPWSRITYHIPVRI